MSFRQGYKEKSFWNADQEYIQFICKPLFHYRGLLSELDIYGKIVHVSFNYVLFRCFSVTNSVVPFLLKTEEFQNQICIFIDFVSRYNQQCYRSCPQNTYNDENSLLCIACQPDCRSCDKYECYWCKAGFFLLGKQSGKDCINLFI